MNLWEAIFSGLLQGLTEFLPVSSSGHLVLLHHFFGYKEPLLIFDIFLHLGTLLAVFVYFRKEIWLVLTKEKKFLLLILAGSVPITLIGFFFESFLRQAFVNVRLVGFMLIVTAFFLFIASFITKLRQYSPEDESKLTLGKALIIGFGQGVSILPGLSRSGITISAALITQVGKKQAIKYSFLLAIPAIIGALVFELIRSGNTEIVLTWQIGIGVLTAFVVGLIAIHYFIKAITKDKIWVFGIYCLLIGSAVLIKI